MSANSIVFYLLALLIIGGGFMAVTSRKIFRSAVYLLFSLIGIAGLYFWMHYEFLAAVQIIVYVGGIVVLIILLTSTLLLQHTSMPSLEPVGDTSVSAIGMKMLSVGEGGYALPFEVVSILLLAAMIGCIVIAIKAPGDK